MHSHLCCLLCSFWHAWFECASAAFCSILWYHELFCGSFFCIKKFHHSTYQLVYQWNNVNRAGCLTPTLTQVTRYTIVKTSTYLEVKTARNALMSWNWMKIMRLRIIMWAFYNTLPSSRDNTSNELELLLPALNYETLPTADICRQL